MPGKDSLQSIANAKKIQQELDSVYGGLQKVKSAVVDLNKYELFGKSSKTIEDVTRATKTLNAELANTTKINSQLVDTQVKQEKARKASTKMTVEEKLALQQKNAEAKIEAKINLAASNSLEKVVAIRAKLRAEVAKTDVTNVDRIKVLNDRIDKLSAIEARVVDKRKAQSLNVGNYEGSAKIIVDALERIRVKQDQVNKKFGEGSPEAQQVRKEYEALDKITKDPKFLNVAAKYGDATAEVKFFTKELIKLDSAGQKNSAVYKEVEQRLAHLTDQIADTRQEIKAMSSDTRGFDLFAGSVKFATDAFQAYAGAAAFFGSSEAEVNNQIKTLVAIQSVATGVQGVANELTTKGTAANKAYNFVLAQTSVLFGKGATSAQRFSAALKLTGIGLAITGITILISKLDIFGNSEELVEKAVTSATEAINKQKEAVDNLNSAIEFGSKVNVERLKQTGADEAKIYQEQQEARKLRLENNKRALTQAQLDQDKYEKELNAHASTISSLSTKKEAERFKEANQKLTDVYKGNVEELKKVVLEGERDLSLSEEQEKTRLADKKRDDEKKLSDKDKETAKKNADNRLQNDIDLERRNAAALAEIREETNNYKLKKAEDQSNNDKLDVTERVNAEKIAASFRRKIAQDEYFAAIQDEKTIQDSKVVIISKTQKEKEVAALRYAHALETIDKESAQREIEIDKDAAEKRLEAQENTIAEQERRAGVSHDNELADVKLAYDKDILALETKFKKGKIKEEAYNKEKLRLQAVLQIKTLEAEISFTKKMLALAEARAKLTGNQEDIDAIAAQQKKIADLEIGLQQAVLDSGINKHKAALADYEKLFDKIKNTASTVFDVVDGFLGALAQRQKNAIQEQINLLDEQKAKDIETANQAIANATEKEAAIATINQIAEAKRQLLETRQRQADERRARFEKAASIAKIIIETATAVVHQLAIGTLFSAIAAGALGAAQLAVAIATPIPKYAEGGKHKKDGPMIVGDGGKSEGVTMPDGTIVKTPAVPTLMYGKAGTIISPDYSKMNLKPAPDLFMNIPMNSDVALKKVGKEIVEAINNKKEYNFKDLPRHKTYMKQGHNFRIYLNNRL